MKKFGIVAFALIVGALIGFYIQPLISGDNLFSNIKKFNNVLNLTYKNYVEKVDSQKLTEAAIKGMLDELDPHSVYISAKDMKSVKEDFEGSFEGIGVEFDVIHDTITVISPIPGGPSEELGIQAGDKIVKIDGEDAVGIERDKVPKRLKGPKGTIVEVDIYREGADELLHFSIKRDKIPLYTVDASFMVDNSDIGVIVINRFAKTTYDEFTDAMDKLKKRGMKKLVLDLRGNPGGFLSQAVLLADELIGAGNKIVYTNGRRDEFNKTFNAAANGKYEDIPIITLINAGSASASEIVSGAIQDLDRGLILGQTSFGKGLVQRQFELNDGSAFRLTTSKYYTPSGRCIQRPYEDKHNYYNLLGRLDLEEGSYIYNSIEKIKIHIKNSEIEEEVNLDSLPVYKTKSGRLVLGGGGVTPDYIVKMDTLTDLGVGIRTKRVFNEFINDYLNVESIKEKYGDNGFMKFYRNYEISQDLIADFKQLIKDKGIEYDEELYKRDEDFILTSIKGNIARSVWSRSEYVQTFFDIDDQFQRALELFPKAVEIAKLNKN